MNTHAGAVGFIGLGITGIPMGKTLIRTGYKLVVFSRTIAKAYSLLELGAVTVNSPTEVGRQSKRIITMVTDSPDVEDVNLGDNGIIQGIQNNTIVIDMSTISRDVTRKIAQELTHIKSFLLDAPVSGDSWGAIEGTLSIMIGGDRNAFKNLLPLLEAMGKNIVYTGPSRMGQTTKLVNQILVAGTMNAVAETLVFAAKSGADLQKAVGGGAAASWQLNTLGPKLIQGNFGPGFMIKLQQKDLRLVTEAAQEIGVSLPGTSLINQFFTGLLSQGHGDEGIQALVKVHEQPSKVRARVK